MTVDIVWVKLRSWHALEPGQITGGPKQTVCGRKAAVNSPEAAKLPAEKSCETCLRILGREYDA